MSLAPTIRVRLTVDSGRVCGVTLGPQGPSPAHALFVGLLAREIPAHAATVFALCPVAQSVAADLAIGAAHGATSAPDRKRQAALACEHLAENLRSLVLGWPGAQPDAETLSALRSALGALRGLADGADADMQQRVVLLRDSAATLGLSLDDDNPAGWFPRLVRATTSDPLLGPRIIPRPVTLDPDDDEAMFASLISGVRAAAPPQAPISIPDHLRARGAAIVRMIDRLASIVAGEDADKPAHARPLETNKGTAAVDSPRGRLFHYVALNDEDRVVDYRTLSPTDRNFALGGPFEQALLSGDIGAGPPAELAVARIAALYDPCVAVEVKMAESANA